jgi:hypothetical protein
MGWTAHKIVLRLRSPLHIGAGKMGNLQRTRPYVAGRNLWGALTARLTRDGDSQGKPAPEEYEAMGGRVHDELAFTYFFPTTDSEGDQPLFPCLDAQGNRGYGWDGSGAPLLDESAFRYHFLSTYASTALTYPQQSAAEGTLHEVECIVPHTLDNGVPVYLAGYVFAQDGAPDWKSALKRLQLGGERGYGWGRVEVVEPAGIQEMEEREAPLFGIGHIAHLDGPRVHIHLEKGQPTLAHALAAPFEDKICRNDDGTPRIRGKVVHVEGTVEPLVGRETKPDTRFGVHLSPARICYAPGARVEEATQVRIGPYGVWERCPEPAEGAP